MFPDLFIRRLVDDAELSWNAAPPVFAPGGFTFTAEPAHASLAIDEVAEPLWSALRWFADRPPSGLDPADRGRWEAIAGRIEALENLPVDALQAPYLPPRIAGLLSADAGTLRRPAMTESLRSRHVPVVSEFSPAVAMFGGVSPNLSQEDVRSLLAILAESDGQDTRDLAALADARGASPLGIPHQDGRDFADDLLDDLGLPGDLGWIDVERIATDLGVAVQRRRFDSRDIRGAALAGIGISPRIVVNETSIYNVTPEGRRFTVAHELCRVLHDRSRARRITHVSGRWVAQGFERRANAFAAYFLMPRELVIRHLDGQPGADPERSVGLPLLSA